ncbi:MAG TPA: glutaredoxin family protein [Dehalococcoidia bacterium]|nr:glutaredoxin family protein [Dehalococcoidia bacterium]
MVKEFLSQLGVAFVVRDVTRDSAALDEFLRRGFRLPPVVVIDDQAIEGFAPQRIEAALEAAGAFDAE